MKKIEIIISADGSTVIEAIGFQGNSCEDATKPIETALGTVANRKKKPEYHQTVIQKNKNNLKRS